MPEEGIVQDQGVASEVRQYLENRIVRRRLLPRAIAVGLASGAIASFFRWIITGTEHLRVVLTHNVGNSPLGLAAIAGVMAAVGCWAAMQIGKLDSNSGGSGIPHMKAVLEGHASMKWARLLIVKFIGSIFSLGCGLVTGREGPTIQMGGAIGYGLSDMTSASPRERRALAASGAGAGLAAAFNAPLAGVTFVLEELQRDFQPVVFAAALLSATLATVVSRFASGQHPAFEIQRIPTPSLASFPLFLLIGALCGVIGVFFNKGLLFSMDLGQKLKDKSEVLLCAIAGLGIGAAFALSPNLIGAGHPISEDAILGRIVLMPALGYAAIRLVLVFASYSTNVPGGVFAPLLSIGALLGVFCGRLSEMALPNHAPIIAACAVAGMCALFSSIVRAPLTGIILIAEMTGSYDLLLPLLAASFTAYAIAEGVRDTPLYEALLQRDALKHNWEIEDGELFTKELEIRGGSGMDGRAIRSLNLPEGLLIIACKDGPKTIVPRASYVLHEKVRIVVATTSPDDLRLAEILATELVNSE